jgi:hypothetical protein
MDLQEGDYEKLTDKEISDVGLNLLSEFIKVVLKRAYPAEVVEAMIKASCASVGCEGLETGDMKA